MRTIIFNGKDSYADYDMLTLKIETKEPTVKKATIDIAGRDGVLDVSEAVAGHIVFNNAEATFGFRIVSDDCKTKRDALVSDIHGKKIPVRISDEEHAYIGRCEVATTNDAGYYLELEVVVDAEPFKTDGETQEIQETISTSKTIVIPNNGDAYVTPTIELSAEMTLEYDGISIVKSAGTFKAGFVVNPRGEKSVKFTGNGAVTITWKEGFIV